MLYCVRTFNQDSSLAVKKGWDDVTGIGSPDPELPHQPALRHTSDGPGPRIQARAGVVSPDVSCAQQSGR